MGTEVEIETKTGSSTDAIFKTTLRRNNKNEEIRIQLGEECINGEIRKYQQTPCTADTIQQISTKCSPI